MDGKGGTQRKPVVVGRQNPLKKYHADIEGHHEDCHSPDIICNWLRSFRNYETTPDEVREYCINNFGGYYKNGSFIKSDKSVNRPPPF